MQIRDIHHRKLFLNMLYRNATPFHLHLCLKQFIMSFEITGKLIAIYNIVQRTENFKTREFVIEKSEEINGRLITNYIKFQCVQDRTSMPDRFNIGDEVKVLFNLKGSKWTKDGKENYITNLDAWRMEHIKLTQEAPPEIHQEFDANAGSEIVDDLPF